MTRGSGPASPSIVAHAGAVAAVAILGAAWIGAPPSIAPQPALFVDLVQAVVATSDRTAPPTRPCRVLAPCRPSPAAPAPWCRCHAVGWTSCRRERASAAAGPTAGPTSGNVRRWARGRPRRPTSRGRRRRRPDRPHPQPAASAPERVAGPPPWRSRRRHPRPPSRRPRRSPRSRAFRHPFPARARPTVAPGSVAREASSPRATPASRDLDGRDVLAPVIGSGERAGDLRERRSGLGGPAGRAAGERSAGAGSRGAVDVARLAPVRAASRRNTIPTSAPSASASRAGSRTLDGRAPWAAGGGRARGACSSEGRLVGVEVVAGATADTLRAAAVAAVRGAAPFPFPPGVEGRPLVIRLPVEFRLR